MVNITYDNENHGMPVVECCGCNHTIQHHERVWFMSFEKQIHPDVRKATGKITVYESEGFCSLECLLAYVGKSIQDEMVECLDDCSSSGGEA